MYAKHIGIWIWLLLPIQILAQEKEYKKFYYPNEVVSSEGWMVNDKPEGLWKSYYPNGVLKSVGKRTSHLLDSTWNFYDESGDLVQSIDYHSGKKNGYNITYYTKTEQPINKGKIKSKELYVNDTKNGMSYYYFEDGSVKEKVNYINNQRDGTAYEYNNDGTLQTIKEYHDDILVERQRINRRENGVKDGIWVELYENGKIKQSIEYKHGELHGYTKYFNRQGGIEQLLLYRNGELVDNEEQQALNVVQKQYKSGKKTIIGSFHEETKVGIHRVFIGDSLVDAYIYNGKGELTEQGLIDEKGFRHGKWKVYFVYGDVYAEGSYLNNKKSGQWNYFYKNGRLLQSGSYVNDKPDGEWIWFDKSGDTLRYEEYAAGEEDGYFVEFNHAGNVIAEGYYIDGEKDGKWYYHTGDIVEKGEYIAGLRDGRWTQTYDNGHLRYEGTYIQGNADGRHKFYYPDGKLREEQYYVMGYKEGNWKKYDENGQVFLVITYENNIETHINGRKIELTRSDF